MFKKLKKKLRRAWKWYIKGDYHCDHCPYCWADYSYEGDCDCGCHIRGDLWDTCRLIPPIRFLIGWPRKKVNEYWEAHAWDGMPDWYEKEERKKAAYSDSIRILLGHFELYQRDFEGNLEPVCKSEFLDIFDLGAGYISEAYRFYEDNAHPIVEEPSIKQQWKDLLCKTWNKLADRFRPYFS